MSHAASDPGPSTGPQHDLSPGPRGSAARHANPWAESGTVLGAVLMIIQGVLAVLQGVAAVARDNVYIGVHNYTFEFNLTSWGWIHIVLGALVVISGVFLLRGATWARAVGIVLAALAVIANFMWLPYTPLWATIGVALGVYVIWALCRTALADH